MTTPWTEAPTGACEHCGNRPATEWWVGNGDMLSAVHGRYAAWCKVCCLREQLRDAEKAAARVEALRTKLREALGYDPEEVEEARSELSRPAVTHEDARQMFDYAARLHPLSETERDELAREVVEDCAKKRSKAEAVVADADAKDAAAAREVKPCG